MRKLRWQIKAAGILLIAAAGFQFLQEEPKQSEEIQYYSESKVTTSADAAVHENTVHTLQDWQAVNDEVYGILRFQDDDCIRSIPVLKTSSPDYAMRHNLYGDYDTMGSVFCDSTEEKPWNLVIYGHSSLTKDRCFTFLKKMQDAAYYGRHPGFEMETIHDTEHYRILSFARYDMDDAETWTGWAESSFADADEVENMFQTSVPYLLQRTDGVPYQGENVITLVTCDMNAPNSRFVLQAIQV